MNSDKVTYITQLAQRVTQDKLPWDNLAQSICDNCYPIRASYTHALTLGQNFMGDIMDSTPVNSREELGNTIDAMLRQGEWFKVGTGDDDRDEDPENARPLERATMLMKRAIDDPRMGFKDATKEGDHDFVSVGQAVLTVEDTADRSFVRTRAWHPSNCAWWNDEDGNLNAMFRKTTVPVSEIKRRIDGGSWTEAMPADLETMCKTEPNKRVELLHGFIRTDLVYADSGVDMRRYAKSPWLSVYIDMKNKAVLHERGEPLNLYVTPRWRSFSEHTYGLSPAGMNSLGDSRMLQQLAMIILEQGEKALDPPMVGSAEVFTRDVNIYGGGFTYVDLPEDARLQDLMTTIQTSDGLKAGLELKQDVRELIIDAWLLNKLYLPSAREMRELEVAVRTEEFRRAALPFFQPIETDYHPKLLGAIFDRLVMRGAIPRGMFPPSLVGAGIHWSFTSPLNEAEGKKIVEAYNSAVQTIAAGSQVDQTIGMVFNMKQAAIDAVRGGGAKADWIYSGKELEQKKAEADQAQQLATASQIANQGALTTANVAGAKQAADAAGLTEAA